MTINDTIIESYDKDPYPYLSYQQTHPDTSATVARLLGLNPPDVENCRVLDVGCAVGGNIVPMAYAFPNSHFVGFDISPGQIELGQKIVDELGLTNVELMVLDIMDATEERLGKFDYIIAHGIYSWVPEDVSDRLLKLCRDLLTENGIANISYNVLPGWKLMGMLRDMMLYHIRDTDEPADRVTEARELATFLHESLPKLNKASVSFYSSYNDFLDGYTEFVLKGRDESSLPPTLMLHDEIGLINNPVYFHQFAEHCARHGLQYVSESTLSKVMPTNMPPEVAQEMIEMSGDIIEMEQYMDFLHNRTFRQTLICHEEREVQRRLSPDVNMMSKFYIASNAKLTTPNAMISEKGVARWQGTDGIEFATDNPITKEAMRILLDIYPQSIAFTELHKQVMQSFYSRTPDAETQHRDMVVLSAQLLQMYTLHESLMELHSAPTDCTTKISDKPKVSKVVRWLVAQGYHTVANMRHQRVQLDPMASLLLPLLDGEHSQRALINEVKSWVEDGKISFENKEGKKLTKAKLQSRIKQELSEQLRWFAHAALLIE